MNLRNKKVLMMGLGILGGGVATAEWLLEQGVDLTITDLKNRGQLASSFSALSKFKDKIKFVLGEHREKDFLNNEIIVINPDVSINNKFVQLAIKNGKQIENELTLFLKFCPSKNIIAVTGTRGKTTTVNWIYHLLKSEYSDIILAGNSSTNPFLGMLSRCTGESRVVLEVPSYQLELLEEENEKYAPKVAVVTNVSQDHLNRHGNLENYAKTKANIFKNQRQSDFLILNKDNKWTDFFVSLKPKSKILYFSKNDWDKNLADKKEFKDKWGEHNILNLNASILVAEVMEIDKETIKKAIKTLPQIKFRQEKVYDNEEFCIYNDSAATSPEATITAIERFKNNGNLILITGGTDRELNFSEWAKAVKENISLDNLVLLSGSATEKMKNQLQALSSKLKEFNTLEECLKLALDKARKNDDKSVILFSPSSKSFEKFKNEYDRGEKFNLLIKKLLKQG